MTVWLTILRKILALYGFGPRRPGRRGPQPIVIGPRR